jgi:hypothetical protein
MTQGGVHSAHLSIDICRLLHVAGRCAQDLPAHAGGAGEGDLVDVHISPPSLPSGRAEAGNGPATLPRNDPVSSPRNLDTSSHDAFLPESNPGGFWQRAIFCRKLAFVTETYRPAIHGCAPTTAYRTKLQLVRGDGATRRSA